MKLAVAAAPDQLVAPLFGRPRKPHPGPHDPRVNREESLADRAKKGEVALPVAAVEVIKKDPAGAARLSPMLDKEIFVAPRFEAAVTRAVVGRASAGKSRVECVDRRSIGIYRG